MCKRLLKAIVISLSLTFLFYTPSFAQAKKEDIQEIAIVSLLGDNFVGRKIPMFKKNKIWYAPVPEWGVNAFAQSTVLGFVEDNPVISGTVLDLPDFPSECFFERHVSKDCKNTLLSAVSNAGFEHVLLVAPYTTASFQNEFGGAVDQLFEELSGDAVGGYGYFRGVYEEGKLKCVFARFTVGVYNVETGKSYGRIRTNNNTNFFKSDFPCYSKKYRDKARDEKIEWQDSFDDYSPEQKELMKSYILQGVKEDLLKVLPKLKLFKG